LLTLTIGKVLKKIIMQYSASMQKGAEVLTFITSETTSLISAIVGDENGSNSGCFS